MRLNPRDPLYANAFDDWAGGMFDAIGQGFGLAGLIVSGKQGSQQAYLAHQSALAQLEAAKLGFNAQQQAGQTATVLQQQAGERSERILKIAVISVGGLAVVGFSGFMIYKLLVK